MNVKLASLALLFCLTTPLLAQEVVPPVAEAKIVLVAPDSARIGELVRFDVSESVADSFKWLLVPQTQDFEVFANGTRAVFSGREAGEYQFIVACAKDGTVDVVTHVVRVIGPPAMPQSDSLTEWIPFWNWSLGLPQTECEQIAATFEAIAQRAGDLPEPNDWVTSTAEANRQALGDRLAAWKPMLSRIGANLAERAQSGALVTPEQYAEVWMEIAEGLRSC